MLAHSFPPIADSRATVLILGSMPGARSLAAGQYYAHPHNAFWPIVRAQLRLPPESSYEARVAALVAAGIALWDVLASCEREGSLDTSIVSHTEVPNDFETFFRQHPRIRHVYFNGGKAEAAFRRHVRSRVATGEIEFCRLPSTSPANASWSFERKLAAWRVVFAGGAHAVPPGEAAA